MKEFASDLTTAESDAEPRTFDPAPALRRMLIVTTHQRCGAYELPEGHELTIGRGANNHIALDDPNASRLHASFAIDEGRVCVRDRGSRNGTWLLGQRIEQAVLTPGASVVVGSVTVTLQLAPALAPAQLGVLSQSCVMRYLEDECARAQTYRRPLALVALRSRRSGRSLPSYVIQRARGELRTIDRIGMYDRDTLLIVLPEMTAQVAARVASRISAGSSEFSATVASMPEAGFTPAQLLGAVWQAGRQNGASVVQAAGLAQVRDPQQELAEGMVRRNPAMLELQRVVERIAPRPLPVLILGETGTGKELIARELHESSPRRQRPLKVVNCAAIPEHLIQSVLFGHVKGAFTGAHRDHAGVFVQASGGTVFLDEVGELSQEAQATLLRVLETQRVCPVGGSEEQAIDLRIVSATHRDLNWMCQNGSFRLDLFHRLNGIALELPPLRSRRDEIEPLVEHFIDRVVAQWSVPRAQLADDARALLHAYHWPGNVRELRNVVERAMALATDELITAAELPSHIRALEGPAPTLAETVSDVDPPAPRAQAAEPNIPDAGVDLRAMMVDAEVRLISEALTRTRGNQRLAARLLKLPLRTFERKLKVLGAKTARPLRPAR